MEFECNQEFRIRCEVLEYVRLWNGCKTCWVQAFPQPVDDLLLIFSVQRNFCSAPGFLFSSLQSPLFSFLLLLGLLLELFLVRREDLFFSVLLAVIFAL